MKKTTKVLNPIWEKLLKLSVVLALMVWAFTGITNYILFYTADLGRHLTNGRLILEAWTQNFDLAQASPLYTNFYSYTETFFPTINHHWLTGVIYYWFHGLFDFEGLNVLNAGSSALAFLLIFLSARKLSSTGFAVFASLLCVPLFVIRKEIRPEIFTNLFLAIDFYLLVLYSRQELSFKKLLPAILFIQILWVNCHLFFVFGFFLIGLFFIEQRKKEYIYLGFAAVLVSLLNPSLGLGLMEPFAIFREYGYDLLENQTIFFMISRFPKTIIYSYGLGVMALGLVSFFWLWQKETAKFFAKHSSYLILFLAFMLLSIKTNRVISLFGLIALLVISRNLFLLFSESFNPSLLTKRVLYVLALLLALSNIWQRVHSHGFSFSLLPGTFRSVTFLQYHKIQGPIFNNYDIGGYLIYNLFPRYRVFVDNRPEAYSYDFFKKIYEPMQASEELWHEMNKKYNFNVIFFMRHDMTANAQPFLVRRTHDPEWAPVFVDEFTIIFLRRNESNAAVIQRYEIPAKYFGSRVAR